MAEKKLKVDTRSSLLNQGTAYWMARMAHAVYLSKKQGDDSKFPDSEKILKDLKAEDRNFKAVWGYSRNSAQGAVVSHRDFVCFAFRGTDQISDWLDNVNISRERTLFGEFHRGFWRSTQDVLPDMIRKWEELRSERRRAAQEKDSDELVVPQPPLFLTGHSLGGAMTTIAAAYLANEDKPFLGAYTFGQPRSMTLDTSRLFNSWTTGRVHRFHNNNDLVPRVPGRLMGYSHVGKLVYITAKKTLHNNAGFWLRFLDAVDGAVEAIREEGLEFIRDHAMEDYKKAIRGWKTRFDK